ncbi:hypothetical protein K474DRAFT_260634 [Panus rudis PR-1116 ss-1]|nr:hypothetical protein K474DRAFT_260634 [Panus rudis PR-1116 ss-1]
MFTQLFKGSRHSKAPRASSKVPAAEAPLPKPMEFLYAPAPFVNRTDLLPLGDAQNNRDIVYRSLHLLEPLRDAGVHAQVECTAAVSSHYKLVPLEEAQVNEAIKRREEGFEMHDWRRIVETADGGEERLVQKMTEGWRSTQVEEANWEKILEACGREDELALYGAYI